MLDCGPKTTDQWNIMDKRYWKKYYNKKSKPASPSNFAKFVKDKHATEKGRLLELGCGNGRDVIFFSSHGFYVVGIDQCEDEISFLQKEFGNKKLKFISGDFTNLEHDEEYDYIYSRFTLHSISEKEESRVINWAYDHLLKGGKFFIEARDLQNEYYGLGEPVKGQKHAYHYEGHFRRFIDLSEIIDKLSSVAFKIDYFAEQSGFAPFEDTDYKYIRTVASKQ